jgi:hypothetical protein
MTTRGCGPWQRDVVVSRRGTGVVFSTWRAHAGTTMPCYCHALRYNYGQMHNDKTRLTGDLQLRPPGYTVNQSKHSQHRFPQECLIRGM